MEACGCTSSSSPTANKITKSLSNLALAPSPSYFKLLLIETRLIRRVVTEEASLLGWCPAHSPPSPASPSPKPPLLLASHTYHHLPPLPPPIPLPRQPPLPSPPPTFCLPHLPPSPSSAPLPSPASALLFLSFLYTVTTLRERMRATTELSRTPTSGSRRRNTSPTGMVNLPGGQHTPGIYRQISLPLGKGSP